MYFAWFMYYVQWFHFIFTWYWFICVLATITRDQLQGESKIITLFGK